MRYNHCKLRAKAATLASFLFVLSFEVERNRFADQALQCRFINPLAFVDVDGASSHSLRGWS